MVESSERSLWWQEADAPAQGLDLTIPIDKTWNCHDLHLSTLVVYPGDRSRPVTPKRAVGVLHLLLGDEDRCLDLTLETPARMCPNQPLTARIKVSNKNGEMSKQVNASVPAVDNGILSITDYVTPDPRQMFFGQKCYGADIYDIHNQVIEGQGHPAVLHFGGDDDEPKCGGKPPVNYISVVTRQVLPITPSEQSEGSATLLIGDSNDELRVIVQAWTVDDFRSNENKVITVALMIAELNMLRFMVSDDTSRLVLGITNLTDKPQKLNAALTANDLLELVNSFLAPVESVPGVCIMLFTPVCILPGYGDGDTQAIVSGLVSPGGTVVDQHKQWKIGVCLAFPAQTANYGTVSQPGETRALPADGLQSFSPVTLGG